MIQPARRLLLSFGFAFATVFGAMAAPAQAEIPYLQLSQHSSKYAAIVVDAKTGEVLYENRADSPRYPASVTKVMTLYLTFEALASGKITLDDRVVFSPHAAAQIPTKLGVRSGDSITVSDAIQAMCTLSANDAAVAMAEKLGGTESRFAALMTLRAQELGMRNTHFANANGLPNSRNLSTARDLATLSRAVMRDYPQYYRYFSQTGFNFRGRHYGNHNHMLTNVPGVDGLKTGFTNASGFNIAVSGVRDNHRLIVVVMGGPSVKVRDRTAEALLTTGFELEARRANGEQITVAQNFFDPSSANTAQDHETAQDDIDESLKVVLASNPQPERTSKIKIIEPKAKGRKASESWGVQVGSFRSRSDAREQLEISRRRFGRHLDDAHGAAEKDDGRYRARFNGLSESEARATCHALKAKRQPCMVLPPRG
jgi:D-alanyl-D-alanine carboxypeptidase (penicillin-binding protein 5/6)